MAPRPAWALVFGVVSLVALRPGAAQSVDLRVDLNERVNAVYHLACLADSITCTKEVFERFWNERLGWSDADKAAVNLWRQTMTQVTDSAPARPPALLLPNTPRFHPGQAARNAAIVAAFESRSARELTQRSRGAVDAEAAAGLVRAVDRVEQRIRPWFRTTRTRAEALVDRVTPSARRGRFAETAAQMTAFLEADLPDPRLYMHAILGPDPASKDYTATQLGNHFVIEAVDAVTADGVVAGAVHEFTHYIYDRAPPEKHRQLIEEFVTSAAPSSSGLYTFLNEAVAIAAQGLHADKNGETPGDDEAYRHPYIAPLGRATIPLVKSAVTRKTTIFNGFAPSYIAAGTDALKEKLLEPQFVLAQVGLLLPDNGDAIRAAYFRNMFPQGSAQFRSEAEMDVFPELNVVRFARYDELGTLNERIPGLDALRTRRGFAYAVRRGRTARTYLLAGRDDDAIVETIEKMANLDALPSEGLILSLD